MKRSLYSIGFLLAALALSACGRSSLAGTCTSSVDCGADLVCSDGVCVAPPDDTNNANNNSCTNGCDDTGPNAVTCFEHDGLCVSSVCDNGDDNCVPTLCDVDCPSHLQQQGCECAEISCIGGVDCPDGLLCIDRVCATCSTDDECPSGHVCLDELCIVEEACSTDDDCAPSQRCLSGMCRNRPLCVFDDDCPSGELCFNGRCTVSDECQVDLDCRMGQECVGGNCFVALCRGPEDCADNEFCDAGECVLPVDVATCMLATQNSLITDGQRIPLEAFAFDAAGRPIAATFAWQSTNDAVARVVPGPNALGGADAGTAVFTASTTSGTACTGTVEFTNPGATPEGDVRAVVHDIESGVPVAGATVQIGNQTATTDASGIATFSGTGATMTVSVFHDDFDWLTVTNVTQTDLRMPLMRRRGDGPVGGFSGQFDTSALNTSGDITLGLAGTSIAGGTLELDLVRLLGDMFVSRLNVPGFVDADIPLPGGVIAYGGAFGFNVNLKDTYYAQSTGGPRISWGLAGMLPFGDLLDFFMGSDFEVNGILGQLLPLFNRFDHAAYPSVFTELPRVVDAIDLDNDGNTTELLPDYLGFPQIHLTPSVRQNLLTDVAISNFPVLRNGTSDLAILVGGVTLPSPGFVPTGVSATTDDDGDGRPDLRRLSIAPGYGPLVSGRYSIVAITFGGGGGGPGGFELPREFSVALWNGQSFPTALSLGTFPNASTASIDNATRSVVVDADAGPLFRLRMVGQDRSWDVWTVGPPGMMGQYDGQIPVPAPPAGGEDLFATGTIFVDAIQTNTNLDDLVAAGGLGLRNAGLVSSAYNRTLIR